MTLHVKQPSVIELVVGDKVQLDRLVPSPHGHVAERHGGLLAPGATTLELPEGFYWFKTLSAANLRVVRGGADTAVDTSSSVTRNPFPDPPPKASDPAPEPPRFGGSATTCPEKRRNSP